jgi:hypothetical protein
MGHVHGLAAVLALDKSLELKDACVDVGFEVVNFFARVLLSKLAHLGLYTGWCGGRDGRTAPIIRALRSE